MDMPQPSEAHSLLRRFAGDWHGAETMHPSPWDPEGGEAVGHSHARVALNGFAVVVDYEQERDGRVTYRGHGVYAYDKDTGDYLLHWFDSIGGTLESFRGSFEGDVLTVSHPGPPMHARLTYDLSEPGLMRTRMEMSPDGETWGTLFDGSYRRAG